MTDSAVPSVPTDPAAAASSDLRPGTWQLDLAHSEIGFTVRHLMTKVRGSFSKFTGTITTDDNLLASSVRVDVELASVDTRNEQRDNHLRSTDFFSVEKTPTMTFQSTSVKDNGDAGYVLVGDLTIADVTKPLEIEFSPLGVDVNAYGKTIAGFEGSAKLSRKEWGVDFNIPLEGGKLLLGDEVTISLDVQAALDD